jgi:hypothetical protein
MTLQGADEIMEENRKKIRQNDGAAAFVDARLAAGHVAFHLADLVKETGLSVSAAENQLRRLARTSRLPGLNISHLLRLNLASRSRGELCR